MGNRVARDDYEWVYTDQPHADRRKEILGEQLLSLHFISLIEIVIELFYFRSKRILTLQFFVSYGLGVAC